MIATFDSWESVRDYALTLPGSEPAGASVKVSGRAFVYTGRAKGSFCIHTPLDEKEMLMLTDPETFCSAAYAETFGLAAGQNILQMDFEAHARHRRLVQHAFTRKALDRWKESVVEPVIRQHVDAFAARGRADLVGEFAFPFPIHVIARLFGLPDDDMPSFHDWASGIMLVAIDYERGIVHFRKRPRGDYRGGRQGYDAGPVVTAATNGKAPRFSKARGDTRVR